MLWLVALSSCVWLVLSSPVVPAIMIHTPMLAQEVVATAAPPAAAARPRSRGVDGGERVWAGQRASHATQAVRRSSARSMPLPSHPLIALWIVGCVALLVRHAIGFVGAMRLARRASVARMTKRCGSSPAWQGGRCDARSPPWLQPRGADSDHVRRGEAVRAAPDRSAVVAGRAPSGGARSRSRAHRARRLALADGRPIRVCALLVSSARLARVRSPARRGRACGGRLRASLGDSGVRVRDASARARAPPSALGPSLVAVGIVSTNDLERRFVAMFDDRRSRASVTSRARAVTASVALAIVCPLASIRVGAPVPPTTAPRLPAASQRPSSACESSSQRRRRRGARSLVPRTISVRPP